MAVGISPRIHAAIAPGFVESISAANRSDDEALRVCSEAPGSAHPPEVSILTILPIVLLVALGIVLLVVAFARWLMFALYRSVAVETPTPEQLASHEFDANPLFRNIPSLKGKIAWRPIGDLPTPVQRAHVQLASERKAGFWVKREDLSSPLYGGNKVRTLEHQLAACEAHAQAHPGARFFVLGSGGSNQCVATIVHGLSRFGLSPDALWLSTDDPDRDNALNMLSCLSFPGKHIAFGSAANQRQMIRKVVQAALFSKVDKVFMPGGANPTGMLGHAGAALELAEQIERGEVDDPEAIYLPVGSTCTITGLILGICLARELGLRAFASPRLKLHGLLIHPGAAALQKRFGFLKSSILPLTIGLGLRDTSSIISRCGGPDVLAASRDFLRNSVVLHTDPKHVGVYGGHTKTSSAAAALYDETGEVEGGPDLWLCGHFSGKAFGLMLEDLEAREPNDTGDPAPVIFWATKSVIQPKGQIDEWAQFATMPEPVKQWADDGGIASGPGSTPDYRRLMTPIDVESDRPLP